jgi:hypothetical protein
MGHLEPLVAILRVGGEYGEPWTWAAVVRYLSPTEVRIEAAQRAPTPSEWRKSVQILKAHGVNRIIFERKKNGITSEHVVNVKG